MVKSMTNPIALASHIIVKSLRSVKQAETFDLTDIWTVSVDVAVRFTLGSNPPLYHYAH